MAVKDNTELIIDRTRVAVKDNTELIIARIQWVYGSAPN